MNKAQNPMDYLHSLDRYRFLTILNAANECEELLFAKQAAMLWLVNYPGDLYVQYQQAKTIAKLGKLKEATSMLKSILVLDPMFIEPYQDLIALLEEKENVSTYKNILYYLTNQTQGDSPHEDWLEQLWIARQAYAQKDYIEANLLLHQSMVQSPNSAIPGILHLKIAHSMQNQEMLSTLSEIYYERWPDCLQINIIKALADMDSGKESQAVERLHWVAAHDSAGQVVKRLMGENHRFQNLWPDRMEVFFDLSIPGSVSGFLGWNQLGSGMLEIPEFKITPTPEKFVETKGKHTQSEVQSPQSIGTKQDEIESGESKQDPLYEILEPSRHKDTGKVKNNPKQHYATEEDFKEIQKTFQHLAKRFKKSDLERSDNRSPVYVILTSKKQLESIYGPNTALVIDELLQNLESLIQNLPDWGALLFYPDDPAQMSALNLKPKLAKDPWQIKLSLSELDQALGSKGEMIGAVLIVGGPEIIPFHHLPNPTHDSDLDVPSDNPYSTVDENYFIPQWPVGRLPGETGSDAGLLLAQIRNLIFEYEKRNKNTKKGFLIFSSLYNWFFHLISNLTSTKKTRKLGYAAEIWHEAAKGVYKTVDNPKNLKLSPPNHAGTIRLNGASGHQLGYFNLHGVADGPNWYGQKDFSSEAAGPDYPIALSPKLFDEHQPSPELVLTEACYGAHVANKHHEEALSLKFLDTGTKTLVGSTCIAYGAVTLPLIAADYLAEMFWRKVKEGQPVGYALIQAKLSLAEEMTRLQGFLDGEDQKTILSFVLFGDPLGVHDGITAMPKPLFRMKKHPTVRTMSDSDLEPADKNRETPYIVNRQVKKIVKKYLPGLQNAQMQVNKSKTMQKSDQPDDAGQSGRYVVTLQKSYEANQNMVHRHFARMTFDKKGKLMKFTISR